MIVTAAGALRTVCSYFATLEILTSSISARLAGSSSARRDGAAGASTASVSAKGETQVRTDRASFPQGRREPPPMGGAARRLSGAAATPAGPGKTECVASIDPLAHGEEVPDN